MRVQVIATGSAHTGVAGFGAPEPNARREPDGTRR